MNWSDKYHESNDVSFIHWSLIRDFGYMELITGPKIEYLLDASLETLHIESQEWLREIDFWNEEMTFLFKLIHQNLSHVPFPLADMAVVEKEMVKIINGELSNLKEEVANHERSLSLVIKSVSMKEEQDYRKRHRVLLSGMHGLNQRVRAFKRNVFSIVKKHSYYHQV